MAVNNNTIMEKAWLQATNDFQQRVPNPTQAGMQATIDFLFDPMNRFYMNQFIDTLVNRIGRTIVRRKRWENRLRAFKGDTMRYGNTIQEIAPKWIAAHSYMDNDETLLKLQRPEAASWYHSVSRQDRYDISIVDIELRRAFTEEYGLNEFISAIMEVPYNSDSYDEYLCMRQLIAIYENTWGFFKVHVSPVADEVSGKAFLTQVRTFAGKLEFPSTLYNAVPVTDIPVFANADELVLITTPEVDASLDVNTLASVFQLDKADLKYRKVIIDEFPIPNAQAILTTKDWFVAHDVVYETTSFYNPQTLATNYYLHHHEIVSCSPFVPAILFTTDAGTDVAAIKQTITSLNLNADKTRALPGDTVQLTTELVGSIKGGDGAIKVAPDAVTYELSVDKGALNSKTYVDRSNVLHIQKTGLELNSHLLIKAKSTYVNPSGTTDTYEATVIIEISDGGSLPA